uniref:Sensory neuron membrane protein 1 n=1 Tax=Cacopsylla melanoneura TaxID=428564 RepID=A0A8D8U096_9HEMI
MFLPWSLSKWRERNLGFIRNIIIYHTLSSLILLGSWFLGFSNRNEALFPQGILLQTARDTPAGLALIDKAIDPIFNGQKSLYFKTTPNQILFDGILLNCTSRKVAPKAVCAILQTKGAELGIQKAGDNIFKVSIFGHVSNFLNISISISHFLNKEKITRILVFCNKENPRKNTTQVLISVVFVIVFKT